ncbi:MAG: NAD(P)-dependent oxidoreductase [Lachnospiraceae bacterium]|nr:NAD(P)-dependent oxidoreductase [Lachnospiraceae bacterium]
MKEKIELSDKRILITGCTGLIGSALTEELIRMNDADGRNNTLTLLVRDLSKAKDRFGPLCDRADVKLLQGDVTDAAILLDYVWDIIIHAAGPAHPLAYSKFPVETMQANLLGTMNLLDHARKQKETGQPIRKFIFFSSGEIYGDAGMKSEKGWSEDVPGTVDSMKERSCYPESKRAAETLCRSYFKEYDIPALAVRLGYIFGMGIHQDNTRADAQFLRKALAGEDIVMKSDGMQLRSYCYVKDAVDAIILLMTKGEAGEAYNIANADAVATIREFAKTMADAFRVNLVFDIPDEVERAGYSRMKKEVLNPEKLYDLGWKPCYSLAGAMQDMKKYEVAV